MIDYNNYPNNKMTNPLFDLIQHNKESNERAIKRNLHKTLKIMSKVYNLIKYMKLHTINNKRYKMLYQGDTFSAELIIRTMLDSMLSTVHNTTIPSFLKCVLCAWIREEFKKLG